MEAPESKSQLHNQQQSLDSLLQSDLSIETDDQLVQTLAKQLETLILNGKSKGSDRDLHEYSDNGIEASKKVLEADPEECRVLDDRQVADGDVDDEDLNENHEVEIVDGDVDDEEEEEEEDLNENHEVEIVDVDGGYEIGGFEDDDEQKRSEDGNDRENVADGGRLRSYHYPLRPDAEDCSYYMRTGMCKYGSNCKFNHPLRRKQNQPGKETHKQKEENMEMHGQIECKYYLSPAGCKYGKSCKFIHGRGKTVVAPVVEYNFLGLPIRPGEKECPYYMRNGSCKYGPNCRFNHPDPSAVGGDAPATYGNDGPLPLQPPPQPNIPKMPTWSGPRTPDPTAAFVPVMYPPTQNMPPPTPDWNGYQAPAPVPPRVYPSSERAPAPVPPHVYPSSDRGLPIPPAFFLNNPPTDTNMYTHQQQPVIVSEYPERPGQPECSYFMKTGDCKYRASCKFHHPKSRITRTTPSALSDKGLPLRPDQNICTYYSRYGICKYGPACKYDHPVNYNTNSVPAGEGYDGSDRAGPLIQQSV